MQTRKKKSGIVLLILLIVIVIPIGIVLFLLGENQSDSLSRGTVTGLSVIYTVGEEEKKQETSAAEEIDFFRSVLKSTKTIQSTAEPLETYRKITLIFHKIRHDVTYTLYLSDSVNDCVFVDPKGTIHLIETNLAKQLRENALLGEAALSYTDYPSLKILSSHGEFFSSHVSGTWNYQNGETWKTGVVSEQRNTTAIVSSDAKPNLVFSHEPDYIRAILTDEKGQILFSDEWKNIGSFGLTEDAHLHLQLSCDWFDDNALHSEYHGTIVYEFDLYYDVPTVCTLSRQEALPGETIVLTTSHCITAPVITASFSYESIRTEKVEDRYETTIILSATALPGKYTVTVMGSEVDETLEFTVLDPDTV